MLIMGEVYSAYKLNKQGDATFMYCFPNFELAQCSLSSTNCCFLSYIQVPQKAGNVVWYSHLIKNIPVCCDPHSQRL